jgi:hypothetical protein
MSCFYCQGLSIRDYALLENVSSKVHFISENYARQPSQVDLDLMESLSCRVRSSIRNRSNMSHLIHSAEVVTLPIRDQCFVAQPGVLSRPLTIRSVAQTLTQANHYPSPRPRKLTIGKLTDTRVPYYGHGPARFTLEYYQTSKDTIPRELSGIPPFCLHGYSYYQALGIAL